MSSKTITTSTESGSTPRDLTTTSWTRRFDRHAGHGARLQARRPARCLRLRCAEAAVAIRHHHAGIEGSAGIHWDGHAGHRRRWADEHHAGLSDAAYARDRRGEGIGSATAPHSFSVPGGGDGDHRRWRGAGNRSVVCCFDLRWTHYFLQCPGEACRGRATFA